MTEENIGTIHFFNKHEDETYIFQGEEGLARICLEQLKARKDYWYGTPPAEGETQPTPENVLTKEELGYYNLSEQDILQLPEVVRSTAISNRKQAHRKYDEQYDYLEEHYAFWKDLNSLLAVPEDEAVKMGRTLRNGTFKSLAYELIESRRDHEYESFRVDLNVKLYK